MRAAEAALKEKGTPSKLGVGIQKALVLSRTGSHPKAKNGKKEDGQGESALLTEVRAALAARSDTRCPLTPQRTTVVQDKDAQESDRGDEDEDESSESEPEA